MFKTRIILVVVGIISVWALYSLPKVVVDNEQELINTENVPESGENHRFDISVSDLEILEQLRQGLKTAPDPEKSAIFADSLAKAFVRLNIWDSAAHYFEISAETNPSEENYFKTGEAYFNAFGINPEQSEYIEKAKLFFEEVIELNPGNLDAKNKLAMSYVAGENPMRGVTLLRSILDADPDNVEALFSLGMLSMQSGQWDKAVERFEQIIAIDSHDLRARFYLGLSSMENGDLKKAKEHLLYVKKHDSDPEVQANVDSYLEQIESGN